MKTFEEAIDSLMKTGKMKDIVKELIEEQKAPEFKEETDLLAEIATNEKFRMLYYNTLTVYGVMDIVMQLPVHVAQHITESYIAIFFYGVKIGRIMERVDINEFIKQDKEKSE